MREALGVRSKQVLGLLREHGPLSLSVIRAAVYPPMPARRAREVIKGLREKGLIRRFNSYLPPSSGNFYALSRTSVETRAIAHALGAVPKDFRACFVRGAEIKHGEQCAIWAEYFKNAYPEAKVVRDWELAKHEDLAGAFVGEDTERDLLPDVVVCFPARGESFRALIAIEIERTKKKSERMVDKIRSLALQTELDGVIYVCADYDVGEALRTAFDSSGIRSSRRIGAYAKDFILYSSFDGLAGGLGPRFVNSGLELRDLGSWLATLRRFPARKRSSSLFNLPA